MPRCSNCGVENPGNAKFCNGCGAALADSLAPSAPLPQPRAASSGPEGASLRERADRFWKARSDMGKIGIGVGGLAILVLICFGLGALGGSRQSDYPKSYDQAAALHAPPPPPTASAPQSAY